MSSPRVQKQFEAMPNQIRRLGKYAIDFREVMRWQGRVDSSTDTDFAGYDAAVMDFDSLTWSTGNQRAILVAEPAQDQNKTAAMKTQSHAAGHYIDGSSRYHLFVETPAAWTGDHARWLRDLSHHCRGQLGSPTKFWFTANGDEPTIKGVNGAAATETTTEGEWMLPYGMTYAGGV